MLLLRGSLGLQHHRNVLHLHQRSARCPATTARKELVTIAYDDLLNHPERISDSIAAAFGPTGLGFLTVRGVPGFSEARQELLPLAWRLASLPQASLRKLEDSASNFAFGWSHGKEKLVGNKPDVSKGSFYANPMVDRVPATPADRVACPSMLRDNVWPEDDLPELR